MAALLLAESGSTKTDWCLMRRGGKPVVFKTTGINPLLQDSGAIVEVLKRELLPWMDGRQPRSLCFYGAGAPSRAADLRKTLRGFFGIQQIQVHGDMLAAARALCGDEKGIVCILGTGSNSCYYNGTEIKEQHASLGYLAGDEGSGNHMGRRVLQYYAYGTFDDELRASFEQHFGSSVPDLIRTLYSEAFPNRFLAGFVRILAENRGHFMVENIVEDCLSDFFQAHLLKYRQTWRHPIHFTGSVAYQFRDVIAGLCQQYELELGTIEASPLKGLVRWHRRDL